MQEPLLDSAFAKALQLYPNPIQGDQLNLTGIAANQDLDVSIVNLITHLVPSPVLQLNNQNLRVNDLQVLTPGICLFNVATAKDTRATIKFFKEVCNSLINKKSCALRSLCYF